MLRVSAIDRLRALPEVFDLGRLEYELGCSAGIARTMASRWSKRRLVERFSSGFFINRVTRPPTDTDWGEIDPMYWKSLLVVFPSATVIGAGPLRAGGLSTQINRRETIAVWTGKTSSDVLLNGPTVFELKPRTMYWYRKVARWIDQETYPIPSLRPEAALADALLYDAGWRPDLDDIDFEDPSREQTFARAFGDLKRQRDAVTAPCVSCK